MTGGFCMNLFKELKLIHWPNKKRIIKEYFAVVVCVGAFSAIVTICNLLISLALYIL